MKRYKTRDALRVLALCAFVMGGTAYALHAWSSLPVVYVSNATGQCVKVKDIDGLFDCENLPTKYERVWVK